MCSDEVHVAAIRGVNGVARVIEALQPIEAREGPRRARVGNVEVPAVRNAQWVDTIVVGLCGILRGDVTAATVRRVVWFVEREEVGVRVAEPTDLSDVVV